MYPQGEKQHLDCGSECFEGINVQLKYYIALYFCHHMVIILYLVLMVIKSYSCMILGRGIVFNEVL